MAAAKQMKNSSDENGMVVWDKHGLVVSWPDGHSSRFSWAALRHAHSCPACKQSREHAGTSLTSRETDTLNTQHGYLLSRPYI
jgi:hypothetical protein